MTLLPGTCILYNVHPKALGRGFPPKFLKRGDVVTCEVQGIEKGTKKPDCVKCEQSRESIITQSVQRYKNSLLNKDIKSSPHNRRKCKI